MHRFLLIKMIAGALAAVSIPGFLQAAEPSTIPPIRDNSFLVEEAYNQEAGVVQHISSLAGFLDNRDWIYTFTQEWPLRSQKHQLSFTVALTDPGDEEGGETGAGDSLINYRYQVLGGGEETIAFAPRLSLILPTGDEQEGRGDGGYGIWINLPVSVQAPKRFVFHGNAGASRIPNGRDSQGESAGLTDYFLAGSLIWQTRPTVNLMLEAAWASIEEVEGENLTSRSSEFFLNPGIRWAINRPSGLQVVPGISYLLGLGSSRGDEGLLLYLSFEHSWEAR